MLGVCLTLCQLLSDSGGSGSPTGNVPLPPAMQCCSVVVHRISNFVNVLCGRCVSWINHGLRVEESGARQAHMMRRQSRKLKSEFTQDLVSRFGLAVRR